MADATAREAGRRPYVEWFGAIDSWSTAKKSALVTGLSVAAHAGFTSSVVPMARVDGLDAKNYLIWMVAGLGALTFVLVGSVVEMLLGRDGAWTPYALVVLYGGWITAFVQALGSWSTPVISLYPIAVILMALYYGQRAGWFAFLAGIAFCAGREVLERADLIEYAPLLANRSLAVHDSGAWAAGSAIVVFGAFLFCFIVGMLASSSRQHQARLVRTAHEQLVRANELVARYAPHQISERILAGEHSPDYGPERRRLTIFFSDVVGFTESSDEMDPESLAAALNEYFAVMTDIAERHGGTVDKFLGDGLMIFFGAPLATEDHAHAKAAVEMALEMQHAMPELNEVWLDHGGRRPLEVRIGINTGFASVGDFGSPSRKTYSAMGVQVNLAARIQAQCEPGKVLISDSTLALVRHDFEFADQGDFSLKGLHYPVRCYTVEGHPSQPPVES